MEHWNGDLNTDTLITLCVAAFRAGKRDVLVKIDGETRRVIGGYVSDGTDLTLTVDRDQVSWQKEETFGEKPSGDIDLSFATPQVIAHIECPKCGVGISIHGENGMRTGMEDDNLFIKPCMLCGETKKLQVFTQPGGGYWVAVECIKCGLSGPERQSKEEAVAVWNDRVSTQIERLAQFLMANDMVIAEGGAGDVAIAVIKDLQEELEERSNPDRYDDNGNFIGDV